MGSVRPAQVTIQLLRFAFLVIFISQSSCQPSREGRLVTWEDLLKGRSGYPTVTIHGYRDSAPATEQIKSTTKSINVPDFNREPVNFAQSEKTNSKYSQERTNYDATIDTKAQEVTIPYKSKYHPKSVENKNKLNDPNKYVGPDTIATYEHDISSGNKGNWESVVPEIMSKSIPPNVYAPSVDNSLTSVSKHNVATNVDYENDFEYDESFFSNDYYEYIDDEEIDKHVEIREKSIEENDNENGEVSQNADRRALDFLYHMFLDPSRNSGAKRRPSLIEEVIETIDRHIVEDVQAWTSNTGGNQNILSLFQTPHQHATPISNPIQLPPIVKLGVAAASTGIKEIIIPIQENSVSNIGIPLIQSTQADLVNSASHAIQEPRVASEISPNFSGDEFLVKDEVGKEYLVSINDIITSLAQLDETEVTNLLLGDSSAVLSIPNPPLISQNNVLLEGNVERPTRQIEANSITSENEAFLIKDKSGNLQYVTMDEILKSLGKYKDKEIVTVLQDSNLKSFMGNEEAFYSTIEENEQPISLIDLLASQERNKNPTILSKVIHDSPIISNDKDGNIILSLGQHGQSGILDLNDKHINIDQAPLVKSYAQDSIVKTDKDGNVHIFPNPNEPFNFDINKIIKMAENIQNYDIVDETRTTISPITRPGDDILEFLTGGAENLPRPIRSSKVADSPVKSTDNSQQYLNLYSNTNHLNTHSTKANSLASTSQNNNQLITNMILQNLPSRIESPTQYYNYNQEVPYQQSNSQESQGLTSTLMNLFSRIIGTDQSLNQPQPPLVQHNPIPDEVVKLVVRQQNRGPNEQIVGHVNIGLPKPIHYQEKRYLHPVPASPYLSTSDANRRVLNLADNIPRNLQQGNTNSLKSGTQKETHSDITNALKNVPLKVQKFLIAQISNKPKFSFPDTIVGNKPAERRSYDTYPEKHSSYTYIHDGYPEPAQPYKSHQQPQQYQNEGPLFGLDFLADIVKVEKIGKHNRSKHFPVIGDASRFVNTRKHHHYH